MSTNNDWWRSAVIYQIYPRSFMDANGDGTGDLIGITQRLDYVASLGVDAIWISPFFASPMKDFGYDVADYRSVDPLFGTLDDFAALLARAHELGLKVIIDQVLSHTSDQHAWFDESRQSRDGDKSDWYVWADAKPDGSPPNNWLSMFGGPAWSWDARRQQYYLHHFLASQPDLNFHNPAVRAAQLENVRFWLDLGVDGFRLDVVNFYFHSRNLESNPAASPDRKSTVTTPVGNPYALQLHVHDITQPENVEYLRSLRALTSEFPGAMLMGEISDDNSLRVMAEYTSGGDRLHTAYTFDLLGDDHGPAFIRRVIEDVEMAIADGWACWALSNHDVVRCPSRWAPDADEETFARVAIAMLIALRGTVCIYQGEELGLGQADVPRDRIQDPYGLPFWPAYKGRDGCRTPMVWDGSPYAGFSGAEPWLPVDKAQRARHVSEQEARDSSCLHATRALLRWRRQQPALLSGSISVVHDDEDVLVWIRRCETQSLLAAFNLTDKAYTARCPHRVVRVHDVADLGGRINGDTIELGPYQGLFADIAPEDGS